MSRCVALQISVLVLFNQSSCFILTAIHVTKPCCEKKDCHSSTTVKLNKVVRVKFDANSAQYITTE